jgi:hypothetical protein
MADESPEFKPLDFHPREFPDPGTWDQIPRFPRGPRDRKPALLEDRFQQWPLASNPTNGNLLGGA